MPVAFTPCTGAVEVTRPGCSDSDFLKIKIDSTDFSKEFVVQGLTLEMSGNYQFLHTVNDFVYFYAFGDRVGSLSVTGVGFLKMCGGASKNGAKIFEIYEYYQKNKSAARKGKSLKVVLTPPSGKPVKLFGFLTGVKIDINQSDNGPVGYWTLRLEVLPDKSGLRF